MTVRFAIATPFVLLLLLLSGGIGPSSERTASVAPGEVLPAPRGSLPDSVDLRPAFDHFGLPPRVQGDRGTCSVFAVTQALEFALASQRDGKQERLSVEYLNWASNEVNGDSLDGSFFSDLWAGFTAHGIAPEEAMPYRSTFDPGLTPPDEVRRKAARMGKAGLRLHWVKEWDPNRGLTDPELLAVKTALAGGWPVAGGFLWPKDAVWTDGLLSTPPREEVFDGHSLLLVGFRDDPSLPGGGVFLIWNSGGPARDGSVTYEYALAYMNDAIWIDPLRPRAPSPPESGD